MHINILYIYVHVYSEWHKSSIHDIVMCIQFPVHDYEAAMFTLTFPPGVIGPHSLCGSYDIIDDSLVEKDETMAVTAGFVKSVAGISLISTTASTTISDNDCKLP